MKDLEKIKDSLIDEYYKETKINVDSDTELIEFKKDLKNCEEKLNLLNQESLEFDINTLDIIEQAHELKEKKKFKIETFKFIAVAFVLLILYFVVILKGGFKTLIISQILIVCLSSLILIPATLIKSKGSEI